MNKNDKQIADKIIDSIRINFRHTEIFDLENTNISITFSTGRIYIINTKTNENLITTMGITNVMNMFKNNFISLKEILYEINDILYTDFGLLCGDTNLIAIKYI